MATIIIAGMHRSGTSLVTQWLNKCGLNVGNYCLGAGPSNLDGHFEDKEFVRLHEDILADNNLPETGLTDKKPFRISEYNQRRLEDLFQLKNDFYDQWGMKDPRTCMFLRHYATAFPDSNYVFIIRDFKSVVSSLLHRDFKGVEKKYLNRKFLSRMIWKYCRRNRRLKQFYQEHATHFLNTWIAYNESMKDVLLTLRQDKYLLLPYSFLHNKDAEVFDYLFDAWKLDLEYVPFKDVYKANLISPVIPIEDFITDETLLAKANRLERELQVQVLLQDLSIYGIAG